MRSPHTGRGIPTRDSIDALLATADRCHRLAAGITDRKMIERLLEMAKECEERGAVIRRGIRGSR